jgi:phospholipid transport system substrate-binding protein
VLAQKTPDTLVREVADDVLRAIREDQALREGSKVRMQQIIEEKVVPHFDFERMTRLAVGKSWREATDEQRKTLIEEFRVLLVRSYAAAYSAYRYLVVEVRPLKLQAADEDVQVKTQMKLPGGAPPVNVDYSMFKIPPGGWKVYDVTVDGVSLVTTYRGTFAERVREGGVDGLVRYLTDVNLGRNAPAPPGAGNN